MCIRDRAYNLSNPFVSMYSKKLAGRHITSPTEIMGTAFEGPFIRREVVEKIGLPNKDLFIFCDDTDYSSAEAQASATFSSTAGRTCAMAEVVCLK